MRGLRFGICAGLLGCCACFGDPPAVDATGAVESTDGSNASATGSESASASATGSAATEGGSSMGGDSSGLPTMTGGSGEKPADEISLYDLACSENAWWELPPQVQDPPAPPLDAACGEGPPEPGKVSQAPNRTLILVPPLANPGVISGAYFDLDLSGFGDPALEVSFGCSLAPTCDFGWTLEVYDPVTQVEILILGGSQDTENVLEAITVSLEGYFMVDVYLTVTSGDAVGPGADHAVLLNPRIVDLG